MKLVLLVLAPFLVSLIPYSFWAQWFLGAQATRYEMIAMDDPSADFSVGVMDYLVGYLFFLFAMGAFFLFLPFWVIYFPKFLEEYRKEKREKAEVTL